MEKKNPIEEAQRYVDNAKSLLREHGELDTNTRLYGDKKYVKMAGNTLWNGVLFVLDAVFHIGGTKKNRPKIQDYKDAAYHRDKKLSQFVQVGYETMHLAMGYDGNQNKDVCDAGFNLANEIINRCALLL